MSQNDPTEPDPRYSKPADETLNTNDPTGDGTTTSDPTGTYPSSSSPGSGDPGAYVWGRQSEQAPPPGGWPGYPADSGSSRSGSTGYGSPSPSPYQAYDPNPSSSYGAPANPTAPYPGSEGYGSSPQQGSSYQPSYGSNPYETNPYETNPYAVNPYQPQYGSYSAYGVVPQQHPQATTAMILGIVGLGFCAPVGIGGLVMGNNVRKAIDAEPQRYTGRGMATAGFVLGIISCVITLLYVLLIVISIGGLGAGS